MYLNNFKIFALSKNKRLINRKEPFRTVGIYDVETDTYNQMERNSKRVKGSDISVLLGEIKPGLYLNCWDLDSAVDENGEIKPEAKDLLRYFDDNEWEFSTSGTGLHIYSLTTKKYNTFHFKKLFGDALHSDLEFFADKRHIVTTTFNFKGTSLVVDKHNDLIDGLIAELEEQERSQNEGSYTNTILEAFEGELDPYEAKARGAILGREPITDMYKLRGCCLKDEKLKELIDMNPECVDQSSHDCALIAKLLYYTLSYEGAWELAKKTNYYQMKDKKHKLKFDKPEYRKRTNDYISNGRY